MSEELNKEFIEKFHELAKANRRPNTFERYMNDVMRYLSSKFPDEDECKLMDAASYISYRTSILATDLIREHDKEWERDMRKQSPKIKRRYEDET